MVDVNLAKIFLLGLLWATSAQGQDGLIIPPGAELALMDGSIDLCCLDISVAGTLSGDGATIGKLDNLTVLPGGTLELPNSVVRLSGTVTNDGILIGGSRIFQRVADCLTQPLPIPLINLPSLLILLLLVVLLAKRHLHRYESF